MIAHELELNRRRVTRRQLFGDAAHGIGGLALASMLSPTVYAGGNAAGVLSGGDSALARAPHFKPRAKRVVCLWQGGGPSHVDLFDPKPVLQQMAGQDIPDSVRGSTRLSTMSANYKKWPITPAIRPFRKYGKNGLELSELLPHLGSVADELCVVR
ncbi:MAG: hypothetical protein RLZZ244_2794, partial [Verrucomicrobiota bacterium]